MSTFPERGRAIPFDVLATDLSAGYFEFRGAEGGVSSAPDPTGRRATVKMSDPSAPSELEKRSTETTASTPLKFSVFRLALAFVIAGVSDVIGAFASLAPPIGWAVDVVTAAVVVVLGWQWLPLPGLVYGRPLK